MVRPEFDTSHHMNIVGTMIWMTISIRGTGKEVIMDRDFYVPKLILVTRNRKVYGIELIKKTLLEWGRFMETLLTITSL